MFKTFIVGVVLGAVSAGVLLHYVPVVDQSRERSIMAVQANGGNREVFYADLPADRIFAGVAGAEYTVPPGVELPAELDLQNSQTELFKVRNDEGSVIGIASRLSVDGGGERFVEWALHMPARGTVYFLLDSIPGETGSRSGVMRGGTREFGGLHGSVFERYQAEGSGSDEARSGRLELITALVGPDIPLPDLEADDLELGADL